MRRLNVLLLLTLALGGSMIGSARAQQPDSAKRQAELARLGRLLPASADWDQWQRTTGELPPDFDALPRFAGLPDPLLANPNDPATRIASKQAWPARRKELLGLVQRYIIGTYPPPPGNVRAASVARREEAGAQVQEIVIEFGPDHRAKLSLELILPKGKGPFPVFLTQHNHRGWALVAVSRGYAGCVYAGADTKDDTGAFAAIWPEHDWTKLTRRAWAASRVIDYLETVPQADAKQVVITGHSRNGKLSLIAAAIDERIAAVVSSSSGAGGACPARLFSEAHFGEGIELLTRAFPDWMHPRLRMFSGREDRLPVDQHTLVALAAPRGCLISTALNDSVESTWAIQETYLAVKPVYQLLGAENRLRVAWRPGGHETAAADIDGYLDWFDYCLGRGGAAPAEVLLHPRYKDWQRASGEKIDSDRFPRRGIDDLLQAETATTSGTLDLAGWKAKRDEVRKRVLWGLGDSPAAAVNPGHDYGAEPSPRAALLGRGSPPSGIGKQSLSIGDYIAADLYSPTALRESGQKLPAVVWLHPHSFSNGYAAGYRRGEQPYLAIARQGFAVLAFDAIGNGHRIAEATRFYDRHPHWSLMGKTVRDALAAVDAARNVAWIDADRIFVLGYGLGGAVGLHAAALDERIAGVVSVAGFTPMRLDTPDRGTGGLARLSHWYALEPRLGAFVGQEARTPYDYHELLALVAPRPCAVISPQLDRENTPADVRACMAESRKVYALYGAPDRLQLAEPEDYNRFGPEMQAVVWPLLQQLAGAKR